MLSGTLDACWMQSTLMANILAGDCLLNFDPNTSVLLDARSLPAAVE